MTKIQLFAAPQTNIFGTTPPSTFVTQTTGFGQTGFGQPNQVIYYCFLKYLLIPCISSINQLQ